uniref:Uncharacterized protein n=1 Tax=Pseudomonas fluorescens (strain SBW25) TaxID=216595 RepID=A0A0G4E515_PSEFS|nr:hypothetical protein [Pseudomonas fluorescens]CEK42326.1 hypothetical protein PQBR57_0373 [Pseudomonas fluorescens SBW25]
MCNEAITAKAIEAGKCILGREIVIQSDADFTPPGKRTTRVVRHSLSGRRATPHIRWYVGSKAYRSLALTNDNVQMTADWKAYGATQTAHDQLVLL